jgi:hypothetical protein
MAQVISAQMTGVKELRKACKTLGIKIDDLKEAYQKVGAIALAAAYPRMPVGKDSRHPGGTLKAGYKARILQTGGKINNTGVPYAGVSEFGGTIPRYGGGRTPHKLTASQVGLDSYYIYPAFAEKENVIIDIYDTQVSKLMTKYFRER